MGSGLKYAVIGGGSWATALVKVLTSTQDEMYWYMRDEKSIDYIKHFKYNRKYLKTVHLDTDKIHFSSNINEIIKSADILVFCIPSAFLIDQIRNIKVSLEGKYIVSAIKGFVSKDNLTVAEYFHKFFDISYDHIIILSGPTHSEEVAMENLSYITFSSKYEEIAQMVAGGFECYYIKTIICTDIYGVEYAAAMKNIYAIAVGICHSLRFGDNFIAVLITGAFNEIRNFLDVAHPDSNRLITTSAYLGDLLVTCYSQFSRNRTFGGMIGNGYTVISARMEMNMVAEGYYATRSLYEISKSINIELPIVNAVYRILYEDANPYQEMMTLLNQLQ